jgi:hypothetical protein
VRAARRFDGSPFRSLAQTLARELHGQVVAFDGKAMRGAIQRPFDGSALHQVHAWVGAQRLLLAREVVEGAPDEGEATIPSSKR